MPLKEKPKYYLKTVGDAFAVLDAISLKLVPMGIAELSKQVGIGRSKVHRILDTLKYWGCVEQDSDTHKYILGPKVLELAMNKLKATDLIKVVSPYLERLVKECEETVHLAVLDKGQVLYLDKKQGPQAIGIISKVGQRLPAHCTGLGKVLLAYLEEESLNEVINTVGLSRFTKNTITDKKRLKEELSKVREQGFAEDNEEIEDGLCCIAAPIRNYQGIVIAAISVSIPAFRMSGTKKEQMKRIVIEKAQRISMQLGYGVKE
jgi:DNA-binding IclR family transcriptional regulator